MIIKYFEVDSNSFKLTVDNYYLLDIKCILKVPTGLPQSQSQTLFLNDIPSTLPVSLPESGAELEITKVDGTSITGKAVIGNGPRGTFIQSSVGNYFSKFEVGETYRLSWSL